MALEKYFGFKRYGIVKAQNVLILANVLKRELQLFRHWANTTPEDAVSAL
jgi:hypothetical protein